MTTRLYTPEMAVDLRIASDVRVSPDGVWVAFCVAPIGHRQTNPTSTVYVVPTDGSQPPRALTGSDHNNHSPRWSPDSSTLAFLADRQQAGEVQAHVIDINGGEPLRLTDLQGGVQSLAWSHDGRNLTFTATRLALSGRQEPKSEIHIYSQNPRPRAIASVAVTGGPPRLIGPASGHVWTYAFAADGNTIAALISPTNRLYDSGDRTWLATFKRGDMTDVTMLTRFMRGADRVQWSADDSSILVLNSRRPDYLTNHVHIVNAASGDVQTLDDRGMSPGWAGYAGDQLLVLNVQEQSTRLDMIGMTEDDQWEQFDIGEELRSSWIMPGVGHNRDGSRFAFVAARDTRPADVYSFSSSTGARRLTDLNPQLDDVDLATMEEVIWTGEDDRQIHGWILRPPNADTNERLPMVVNVHGGPSMAWGNWFHGSWHDWAQVLAARGYVVFLPNPRGSTGKGQIFESLNRSDLGGQDFHDVMRGVSHLVECGVADPERLGIGGWSYGGFLTALTVVRSQQFKAAVAGAAVTNWVSKVGTTDIRPFNEWNFPGRLHQSPDAYWIRSPIRYLKNASTPTLVVHGEADPRVPVSQGLEFFNGLQAMGVETDFVTYPRQKHAFHEREFQLDLLRRICAWFDRYLMVPGESGADAAPES